MMLCDGVLYRLGLGIYKCKQMGLVPMGTGDWLQFETRAEVSEKRGVEAGWGVDELVLEGPGMVCCAICWNGKMKRFRLDEALGA